MFHEGAAEDNAALFGRKTELEERLDQFRRYMDAAACTGGLTPTACFDVAGILGKVLEQYSPELHVPHTHLASKTGQSARSVQRHRSNENRIKNYWGQKTAAGIEWSIPDCDPESVDVVLAAPRLVRESKRGDLVKIYWAEPQPGARVQRGYSSSLDGCPEVGENASLEPLFDPDRSVASSHTRDSPLTFRSAPNPTSGLGSTEGTSGDVQGAATSEAVDPAKDPSRGETREGGTQLGSEEGRNRQAGFHLPAERWVSQLTSLDSSGRVALAPFAAASSDRARCLDLGGQLRALWLQKGWVARRRPPSSAAFGDAIATTVQIMGWDRARRWWVAVVKGGSARKCRAIWSLGSDPRRAIRSSRTLGGVALGQFGCKLAGREHDAPWPEPVKPRLMPDLEPAVGAAPGERVLWCVRRGLLPAPVFDLLAGYGVDFARTVAWMRRSGEEEFPNLLILADKVCWNATRAQEEPESEAEERLAAFREGFREKHGPPASIRSAELTAAAVDGAGNESSFVRLPQLVDGDQEEGTKPKRVLPEEFGDLPFAVQEYLRNSIPPGMSFGQWWTFVRASVADGGSNVGRRLEQLWD